MREEKQFGSVPFYEKCRAIKWSHFPIFFQLFLSGVTVLFRFQIGRNQV